MYINGIKQKFSKTIKLVLQNMIFIIFLIYPLLASIEIINIIQFDNILAQVNEESLSFVQIYYIVFSIYLGWLFLEIITIFRNPRIKIEVQDVNLGFIDPNNLNKFIERQVILKLSIRPDLGNYIIGTNSLEGLMIEKCIINGRAFVPKWGSSAEPLDYSKLGGGQLTLDPSKIPGSEKTLITKNKDDYLVLCWVSDGEYYIADPWLYHNKTNVALLTKRPLNLEVSFYCSNNYYEFITRF